MAGLFRLRWEGELHLYILLQPFHRGTQAAETFQGDTDQEQAEVQESPQPIPYGCIGLMLPDAPVVGKDAVCDL